MTDFPLQGEQAELPTPNSTFSYWHRDPSRKLLGHRTTENLPSTADVVVVGSGITGTFAARELVAGGRGVVMLEAREACWGATGRVSLPSSLWFSFRFRCLSSFLRMSERQTDRQPQNGGHCQPGVWDSAPEIARFELSTFDLINKLVTEYDIPCDWHIIGGVHAIYSQEVLIAAQKQIKRLQQHSDLRDKAILIQDKSELAALRVPEAVAAVYQPKAAKCWPYKLVTWLLERLLSEHDAAAFNLQTNTSVKHLQQCGSSWIVHTQRGQISVREVLLATNAYTSYLLPNMTGLIVPVRGQVCALEPPQETRQLSHSYVWLKGADHQYLIQRGPEDIQMNDGEKLRRSVDRSLIFGGERLAAPGGEEGISRDDEVNPMVSQALQKGLDRALKLLPEDEPERDVLRAAYEWTGIMGYSRDSSPWVGCVPGTRVSGTGGLWISAGYSGHGMPVAARCGVAVAEMILGREGGVQVPQQWVSSEERMERAKRMELPRTLSEMIGMLPAES